MNLFLHFPNALWWYCGCLLAALLVLPLGAPAQAPPPSIDYITPLKAKNLSYLWRADQLVFYGSKAAGSADNSFPEPLGFIGTNYQRFYLHYTSVRPAPGQPYVY